MRRMSRITNLLFAVILAMGASAGNSGQSGPNQALRPAESAPANHERAIKVTIASTGPMLGPPTTRYRVGEQIPIAITMTNTSSQPLYACVSADLYEDTPSLTRNGRLVPFAKSQSSNLETAQKEQTCQHEDLPEATLLKPNEPTIVDWLVLVDDSVLPTGAVYWYDPLTPGVYELSIQRRFGCCDGPMISSNTIRFEVFP